MEVYQTRTPTNPLIFQQKSGWFFPTREGIDMGPFPDKMSAQQEFDSYSRYIDLTSRKKQR